MRSIIPAVKLEIDLGDGLKTYKLRRTNFASVALMGVMGSPELAAANAALDGQRKLFEDKEAGGLGGAFVALRLDHQCRLIAAQLFALLQYDHPDLEYRDVLAAIPADPAVISEIGRACIQAWQRGEPPKLPKVEAEEMDSEPDPTPGRRGGNAKRGRKPSQSSSSESTSTITTV